MTTRDQAAREILAFFIGGSGAGLLAYAMGKAHGVRIGVSKRRAEIRQMEIKLRRKKESLGDFYGTHPVLRSAVIKPTASERSQVELDDQNR